LKANPRLLYLDPISYTGLAYYSYSFLEALSSGGRSVVYGHSEGWLLSSKPRTFDAECLYRGVSGSRSRERKGLSYLRSTLRVLGHVFRQRYSMVHLGYVHIAWVDLILVIALRVFGRHVVVTVHEVEDVGANGRGRSVRSWLARAASTVIVQNHETRRAMLAAGVRAERLVLMPPGGYEYYDDPSITRSTARESLGLPPTQLVVLCFGSLTARKDVRLLLEAFSDDRVRAAEGSLHVVGRAVSGYDLTADLDFVEALGLSETVTFKPEFVSVHEAECWYKAADLLVLPYTSICESAVLRQAFTYGCPTIVSALPELADAVVDGDNCLLYEVGDARELSDRIVDVLTDPQKRDRLGSRAAETMTAEGSWAAAVRRVEHVYS